MTNNQDNKRLRMIKRIHKKLNKSSVKMNDIADYVIGYTENDINEELDNLTKYKADAYRDFSEE